MKAKWLPVVVVSLVAMFVGGIILGTRLEIKQNTIVDIQEVSIKDKIAIVNGDIGIVAEGEQVNYSDALIEAFGRQNYTTTSPSLALSGLQAGDYSGIVTFPSNLSESVVSINLATRDKLKLEFFVNPNLPEDRYIAVYEEMLNLQFMVNSLVSYTYVTSVFNEFHDAQDKVEKVLQNDKDDMAALDAIELADYAAELDWGDIPTVDFEPKKPDYAEYLTNMQTWADEFSKLYLDSYAKAKTDYATMGTEMKEDIETIATSYSDWLASMGVWSDAVKAAADANVKDSETLTKLQEELAGLEGENKDWNTLLVSYSVDLEAWRADLLEWEAKAKAWQEGSAKYVEGVDAYAQGLKDYVDKSFGEEAAKANAVLTAWNSEMKAYNTSVANSNKALMEYTDGLTAILAEKPDDPAATDYADKLADWAGKLDT
jgi:uncharacterized phage infection (PIP) family protein YhgE